MSLFNILKFNNINNIRNCCYLTTSSSLSFTSCIKNEQQSKKTITTSTNPLGSIATTTTTTTTTTNNTINNNNYYYYKRSPYQQKTIQQLRNFSHSSSVIMSTTTSNSNNTNKRVLSIQSHVVQGYVGNKSATFPLQVLGFDVDAINSVQFSNHTGYGTITGQVLSDKELIELFGGLKDNQLLPAYTHLLTGYVGKDSFLQQIGKIVKSLRDVNPNLIYVCDPVLGDNGKMYVPENLLPIYRNEIIPLCDICTPNQYEVELLTGRKIKKEIDIWMAVDWFHNKGVKTIVVSSTDLGGNDNLLVFLSHKDPQYIQYTLSIPKQGNNIHFTGTGDLFAALFLAHSTISMDLRIALEKTIATLQSVIQNTINGIPEDIKRKNSAIPPQHVELKLVQSKTDIENPNVVLFAKGVLK